MIKSEVKQVSNVGILSRLAYAKYRCLSLFSDPEEIYLGSVGVKVCQMEGGGILSLKSLKFTL